MVTIIVEVWLEGKIRQGQQTPVEAANQVFHYKMDLKHNQ